MRFVAIDLGDRRTGLAVGDRVTGIVSPAGLIEIPRDRNGGADLLDAVAKEMDDLVGPTTGDEPSILLGLPLNMDGSEGPRAKIARAFAADLATRIGTPILLWDERRTSLRADERLARTGLTHKQKKKRRDAIAAAAILQDFLENRPENRADDGPIEGSVVRPNPTERTAE